MQDQEWGTAAAVAVAVVVAVVVVVVVVVADTSAGATAGLLDVDVVDVATLHARERLHHVSFSHVDTGFSVARMIMCKNHT